MGWAASVIPCFVEDAHYWGLRSGRASDDLGQAVTTTGAIRFGVGVVAVVALTGCERIGTTPDAAMLDASIADVQVDGGPQATPFPYDVGTPNCAPCPPDPPVPGTPCALAEIQCEYGTHPLLGCNDTYSCAPPVGDAGAQWHRWSRLECPPPPIVGGPCPNSFGASDPCSLAASDALCGYPEGFCQCRAGAWVCDAVPPGCRPRPRLGCPCASCDRSFGTCAFTCGSVGRAQYFCTE